MFISGRWLCDSIQYQYLLCFSLARCETLVPVHPPIFMMVNTISMWCFPEDNYSVTGHHPPVCSLMYPISLPTLHTEFVNNCRVLHSSFAFLLYFPGDTVLDDGKLCILHFRHLYCKDNSAASPKLSLFLSISQDYFIPWTFSISKYILPSKCLHLTHQEISLFSNRNVIPIIVPLMNYHS